MALLSKKRKKLHQTAAIAVSVIYLFVSTSVDLFHTEDCIFGDLHPEVANTISSNQPCPACAFLAGHHSTGAHYAPALLNAELLFALQSSPPSTVVLYREWAYSIISRAPPSAIFS